MTKQLRDVYIVAATRTPIGKSGRGSFKHTRPDDLLVATIKGALAQVPSLDPAAIEDSIIGCAMPEGEQGMNVAKIANLLAGLPKTVAGVTINRFCASGITAVSMAAGSRVGTCDRAFLMVATSRSSGRVFLNTPRPDLPIGVRVAATM